MKVPGPLQDVLVPDWPAPAAVHALCSTRAGGVSLAPYDSLNLGNHVGDTPADVAMNRQRWAARLGARPVFMEQVHGVAVAALSAESPDGLRADACVATQAGVACTIMVADCLPVLFTDRAGRAVAAAHAGWRGLAGVGGQGGAGGQGVLASAFDAFSRSGQGIAAADTLAWLGPCIGPRAFEVGPEVMSAFVSVGADASACFKAHTPGKWLCDLAGLARLRLRALGIDAVYGNDGSPGWCTVGNPSVFFSHRRDRISGRFAACVWLG